MKGCVVLSLVLLSVLKIDRATCSAKCGVEGQSPGALKLSVLSKRNKMGKWVTEFRAYKDDTEIDLVNDLGVEVKQDLVVCDGRRTVTIQGKITGLNELEANETTQVDDEIRFHRLTGMNAVLFNEGRTVAKRILTEVGYGLAFTNRPLKDNELFEVTLEKKTNIFKHSLGVGISTLSPEDMVIPEFITQIPSPNWSMHYNYVYGRGGRLLNINQNSLDTLGVGDRVGVMRSSKGDFHVFINGEDQGVAVSNIPPQVYGVIELYANAARATIVKRS